MRGGLEIRKIMVRAVCTCAQGYSFMTNESEARYPGSHRTEGPIRLSSRDMGVGSIADFVGEDI